MKWKIRDIEIENQIVLAPMAGNTNEAFRVLAKELGCGLTVAEMVSDKAIGFQNQKTLKMTKVEINEHPVSMQIFGSDVNSMVNAAKYIDLNSDADIIDINMGCPVNKVAKRALAGAALMLDPDKVYEIVSEVVKAVKKPVTVKMRLGWDIDHINCVEIAKLCEKAGASAICLHARTRKQMYAGHADWSWIKKVKEAVSIPVIGNGDVVDIYTAKRMLEETGCDAIAIARASLGNPFIFREIKAYLEEGKIIDRPSNKELFDTIKRHYDMLLNLKGEHLAMLEMRSHVAWYIKGMPGSSKIKDLCNHQTNFNDVLNILKDYLKV